MSLDGSVQSKTEGPLSGIRVLELTHAWAGPYCGMMLADMGAEVLKIESPRQQPEARGGYPYANGESVIFMMLHRNKKSVTIDLKHPRGHEIFLELVRSADVLIQNFRPGLMSKLGLDYKQLSQHNPGLIYASLSGYGSTGPYSDDPGVDMIALALSGLAATTMENGRPPVSLGGPVCDIGAGMWAAFGILSAYVWRQQTGRGQHVDASLLEAGLAYMVAQVAMHYHTDLSSRPKGGRRDAGNAPSGFFRALDGHYIAVFASYPALWDRFVVAMGLQHLDADPRFGSREQRTTNAEALHDMMDKIFGTQPASYWVELLRKAGVPAGSVNTVAEMVRDPQVLARDMLVPQEHPTAGTVHMVGVPVKLSAAPGQIRHPPPTLGEHTDEVLGALGLEDELTALHAAGIV